LLTPVFGRRLQNICHETMNDNYLEIISASSGERRDVFLAAATRLGTTEQNVEKDFWVCWVLDALFHGLPPGGPRLLFKGGTSLSKAFGLISRFSEDIDITVFRQDLGQPATVEQLEALNRKKRNARLDAVKVACQHYISSQLRGTLAGLIDETAQRSGVAAEQFRAAVDEDDPDNQSLLLWYPAATPVEGYVRQAIKIELGAKSALDPNCETRIRPYIAEDISSLDLDILGITTVDAERTFWDKVIIVHGQRRWFEIRGELQHHGQRVSRHYYDVYRLLDSDVGRRALADSSLSHDCVRHARMFFDRPDFDLASAVPGTLALSPPPAMTEALRRDYGRMAGMIMGAVPEFNEVIARIREFKTAINASA
jgi:hypothetical protein